MWAALALLVVPTLTTLNSPTSASQPTGAQPLTAKRPAPSTSFYVHQRRCSRPPASPGQEANATATAVSVLPRSPPSGLEVLPPGVHEVVGSFVNGKDIGNLSLGSRWCLKTFVEEGESNVTIKSFPDKASMPEIHGAMYLAAFLRRRQRMKSLIVMFEYHAYESNHQPACPDLTPLALAFAAGSCRQLEELHWDVDHNTETVASAIALNALPCLKVLDLRSSGLVRSMMMGLATGGSPLFGRGRGTRCGSGA